MDSSLKTANAVIAARQFNPTIFDQIWLIDHGVASREDFRGENAFMLTPPFVQFRSPTFVLAVLPEQLQFTPQPLNEHAGELVRSKVGRIVELLPHTPYVAIGLNFVWQVVPSNSEFRQFCRALFFRENPLFDHFATEDARYGGYLSKDSIGGTRLKLDIKPVRFGRGDESTEAINFNFNYNLDLPRSSEAVTQILATLDRWTEAWTESHEIVENIKNWSWKR